MIFAIAAPSRVADACAGAVGTLARRLSLLPGRVATNVSEIVTAVLAYAAGVATTTAATSAYITDMTRRARYGAAHGVFGTIYDIGDALGPIAAGVLAAALGYTRMFQIMASVALTMAAAFAVASRIGVTRGAARRT